MTIEEYYNTKQPISDITLIDSYEEQSVIIIGDLLKECYVMIAIAHPDEDYWAFGWEIRDGDKTAFKECSPNNITKGAGNNLLYGVIKLLINKITKIKASAKLKAYLTEALQIANKHYTKDNNNTSKITI